MNDDESWMIREYDRRTRHFWIEAVVVAIVTTAVIFGLITVLDLRGTWWAALAGGAGTAIALVINFRLARWRDARWNEAVRRRLANGDE